MNTGQIRNAGRDWAESAAENAWVKLVARASILAASLIGMPVALTMGWRTFDAVKEFRDFQVATQIRVERLADDVSELERQGWTIADADRDRQDFNRRFSELREADGELGRRIEILTGSIRSR